MNRLDIYETPRGWRVGIWVGRHRIRWPKHYRTEGGARLAYDNTVRAHRIHERQETSKEGAETT
jgi:hypothetical protein